MSKKQRQAIQAPSLPNRENIITAQLSNLLSVFIQTGNFLVASQIHSSRIDEEGTPRGGALDGGAKCAVETTMINLCNRFDTLLKDDSRWSLTTQKGLEKSVRALYDAQTEALRAQTVAYKQSTAPHVRFKPVLVKMKDGSWLAFHGNPADLENALCGAGDCPAAAIEAFDCLFSGQTNANLRELLETHTVDTNEKTDTKQTLDSSGTGSPPDNAVGGGE